MGLSFRSPRFNGPVNHDRRTETNLPHCSYAVVISKCRRDHTRLQHSSSKAVYRGLVGERDNRRNQGPHPLFLFPPLHSEEKVREVASHNRPIHLEQVDLHPQVQNGDFKGNYKVEIRGSMGYLDRCHRRLSSCSHSSCFQEILCLQL